MSPRVPDNDQELTRDPLFSGRVVLCQPKRGYRFSVDAVLLAHFVAPRQDERILDLGTGVGVLPVILSYRRPGIRGVAIEIQPRLAGLAEANLAANGLAQSWQVVEDDFRRLAELLPPESFDWVVSNPPYRQAGSSRQNPMAEQAVARHELRADLSAVGAAMGHALKPGGRAAIVYPAARLAALLTTFRHYGLEPKRLQIVYGYPGAEGRLVLVEALKGGGEELEILPPFYIARESGGKYTPEMASCYRP